jgi:hypothetical protein
MYQRFGRWDVESKSLCSIVNFKEGLANKKYQYRNKNDKANEKGFEIVDKDRKKEIIFYFQSG